MLTTHPIACSLLPFMYNTERFCVLAKFKKLRNALLISRVMNLFISEVHKYRKFSGADLILLSIMQICCVYVAKSDFVYSCDSIPNSLQYQ